MGWLDRWDRWNQHRLVQISTRRRPEPYTRGLHWQQSADGWFVDADRRFLLGYGATLNEDGITARRFLCKRVYPWSEVSAISWNATKGGWFLCLCVSGSPHPKVMDAVGDQ